MDFYSIISFVLYSLAIFGSALSDVRQNTSEPTLEFVNVVFRHGDRAPTTREVYPNDPYKRSHFYPDGYGQLTIQGKLRASELGRQLRARYGKFLNTEFPQDYVDTVSTSSPRAQETLRLALAELFPERRNLIATTVLNNAENSRENFMTNWYCPRYDSELHRVKSKSEVKSEVRKFRKFMHYLSIHTGMEISGPSDMLRLYHTLDAESSLNLRLPEWTRDIFPRGRLLDGAVLAYRIKSYSPLLRKLNGGKLLLNMIQKMEAAGKSALQNNLRMNLYSGHETNIAALLNTLGVYKPHVPQYTSAVVIEFYEQNFQHYVKVLYYHGRPNTFEVLQIPGCDELCPWRKFLKLMKDVIPEDESICH